MWHPQETAISFLLYSLKEHENYTLSNLLSRQWDRVFTDWQKQSQIILSRKINVSGFSSYPSPTTGLGLGSRKPIFKAYTCKENVHPWKTKRYRARDPGVFTYLFTAVVFVPVLAVVYVVQIPATREQSPQAGFRHPPNVKGIPIPHLDDSVRLQLEHRNNVIN